MHIGHNIKEIRINKEYTTEFMANEVGITNDEYVKIEEEGDALLSILKAIASRLSTTVVDLMLLNDAPYGIRNYFNNNNGNQGKIYNIQAVDQEQINDFYKNLYFDQVKRVPKFEKLLIENNIPFDF